MSEQRISLSDDKYTIIFNDNPFKFEALRYGEPWRNLTGDNLILALFQKIEDLELENKSLKNELRKWNTPVNGRLELARKQYNENSDSLAANNIYIRGLEHSLKHMELQIKHLSGLINKLSPWDSRVDIGDKCLVCNGDSSGHDENCDYLKFIEWN